MTKIRQGHALEQALAPCINRPTAGFQDCGLEDCGLESRADQIGAVERQAGRDDAHRRHGEALACEIGNEHVNAELGEAGGDRLERRGDARQTFRPARRGCAALRRERMQKGAAQRQGALGPPYPSSASKERARASRALRIRAAESAQRLQA